MDIGNFTITFKYTEYNSSIKKSMFKYYGENQKIWSLFGKTSNINSTKYVENTQNGNEMDACKTCQWDPIAFSRDLFIKVEEHIA